MLSDIITPIVIVSGLGLVFGLMLSFVSKKFEVKVDEKAKLIRDVLPGANCAACGFNGCDAFAEALAEGKAEVSGCPVGGKTVAIQISKILGKEEKAEFGGKKIARVICGSDYENHKMKYNYIGIKDCYAASSLYGGPSACDYGCIGFGTCISICPFNAIVMKKGLAKIVEYKCTGCELCVKACPKNIIKMVPIESKYTVACNSTDKGNMVRKVCNVGCIGCARCVKVCKVGAITLEDSIAKIDPDICINCGECAKVCPTSSISQF